MSYVGNAILPNNFPLPNTYPIPPPKKEDSIAKSWMGRSNNCSKVVNYTLINN